MLGDGCLCFCKNHYIITITCNLYDDWPFFDTVVCPLLSQILNKKSKYRIREKYSAIEFNFSNKYLFHKLRSIGFPVGKKGSNLIIPPVFYKKNLLKYITQGFFATDGSLVLTKNPNKFYPRLESETIHKLLISQIHRYLISLGMYGHFYFSKSKPNTKWLTAQQKYKFQFNGKRNIILFRKLIGFVNPKHE